MKTKKASNPSTLRAARMMPVVQRIARSLRRRLPQGVDLDDLVSAGALGLAEAIRNHAGADDETFEKNAVWRIRGAIFDAMRQNDVLTRCQRRKVRVLEQKQATIPRPSLVPVAMGHERYHEARSLQVASSASQNLEVVSERVSDASQAIDDQVDTMRRMDMVQQALSRLSPRLARVLDLSVAEQLTLKEIGTELGVSEARACQLRTRALEEVRLHIDDSRAA